MSVLLGATAPLSATVSNTSDTAVSWSVAGIPGGNGTVGTISASGVFTAPQFLPVPGVVTVQATSVADASKTATSTVTITSDIRVTAAPTGTAVELGATQLFQATVTSAGQPSTAVNWAVNGSAPGSDCPAAACGTVSAGGLFTAPRILPSPPSVVLTATSIADPSRSAAVTATVTGHFAFSVSGPSSVNAATSANFAATLTPQPNSNPAAAISWSVSGTGCAGAACGSIAASGSGAAATYTAPAAAPSPNQVTLTATPLADPSKAASLSIMLVASTNGGITIALAPAAATLSVIHRQTFTAQISGSPGSGVVWQVNAISGGNATVGQVCVVNSSPCQAVTSAVAGSVDYLAPSAVPAPNPVTLRVISQDDPTKSAVASITILPHIVVGVSPPSALLAPGGSQTFVASVSGTANQQVTWSLSGTACAGAGAPCGVIDATGLYVAPLIAPTPKTFNVVATSSEDTSRFASASVTVTLQPVILSLLPSSATAGAAGGFTLLVTGGNFIATSPGPGSAILVGGTARATVCSSTASCSTTLTAQDLLFATNLGIAVQNPGGAVSNAATFVVAPPPAGAGAVLLTPGAPAAANKDIIVVDLSTNGSSSPPDDVSLNIVAIGIFQPASGNCTLGGGSIALVRPVSGTATADLCAFSVSGLDPSFTYTVSGPAPPDLIIVGEEPLGLGIVHLTLQLPSTALAGVRTLFIQNAALDMTAASGSIEIR